MFLISIIQLCELLNTKKDLKTIILLESETKKPKIAPEKIVNWLLLYLEKGSTKKSKLWRNLLV